MFFLILFKFWMIWSVHHNSSIHLNTHKVFCCIQCNLKKDNIKCSVNKETGKMFWCLHNNGKVLNRFFANNLPNHIHCYCFLTIQFSQWIFHQKDSIILRAWINWRLFGRNKPIRTTKGIYTSDKTKQSVQARIYTLSSVKNVVTSCESLRLIHRVTPYNNKTHHLI